MIPGFPRTQRSAWRGGLQLLVDGWSVHRWLELGTVILFDITMGDGHHQPEMWHVVETYHQWEENLEDDEHRN